MATTKRKSRIFEEMHETAQGLYETGIISKRRMDELEALCNLKVHELSPRKIKSLREASHVSQAVFAAVLNTSTSTVQKWEIGDKKPSGPSLKLLNLIERKGIEVVL
jgi:putative transcriptional regulator